MPPGDKAGGLSATSTRKTVLAWRNYGTSTTADPDLAGRGRVGRTDCGAGQPAYGSDERPETFQTGLLRHQAWADRYLLAKPSFETRSKLSGPSAWRALRCWRRFWLTEAEGGPGRLQQAWCRLPGLLGGTRAPLLDLRTGLTHGSWDFGELLPGTGREGLA